MAELRNKKQYYRAWRAGLLGNRPRTWKDAAALRQSGWAQPVVMRSTTIGFATRYAISVEEALRLAETTPGATFNECLPDEALLLQGEVSRTFRGLELTFTRAKKPMKQGFAEHIGYAQGLSAKLFLEDALWPPSLDDLWALLELYPDAVVEFSSYSRAVGDQPHRNTILWEVRNY